MNNKKHNINIKDGKNRNEENVNNGTQENEEKKLVEEHGSADEYSKLENEIGTLKDMLQRKAAEFENYKRRTDLEISNYIKYASENIIKDLIPVYDDLGRSIESINKGETKDFEKEHLLDALFHRAPSRTVLWLTIGSTRAHILNQVPYNSGRTSLARRHEDPGLLSSSRVSAHVFTLGDLHRCILARESSAAQT